MFYDYVLKNINFQAELKNRIRQAEDLKRQQQKAIKREQLRVQVSNFV
jgi:hypothetical protein